jgi:hypothetical protein
MAWQDEMTLIERALLGDLDSVTYSDANLQQLITVAARQVLNDSMTFTQAFVADVTNVDIAPDPTDDIAMTRDDVFSNLVCLKAASLVERSEAFVAARQAISVVDSKSAVNLTGIATARLRLMEKGGYAKAYADAKFEYQSGQVRVAGAAVMTPFRVWAQGGFQMRAPGRERDLYY